MNNEYKFILADDRNGNKALVIVKGDFDKAVHSNNVDEITDPAFNSVAKQLIKALDATTIKGKKAGDK